MSGKSLNLFRSGRSQWAIRNTSQCSSMQLRTFTSSLARRKPSTVPVFKPTSSPELDELLKNVREKIILPAYLSRTQRDLIFKRKHWKSLEIESVVAKIGDEEFQLQPIDIMNDVPNYVDSTFQALHLMESRSDYENLIGLLEGMNRAKGKVLKRQYYGKIARILGQAGRQDILLECVRQASRTGFTLNVHDRAIQVLAAMSQMAYADWDAVKTDKAFRWSEHILDLMEEPMHTPESGSRLDMRKDPTVLGRVLELAAMRASKHQGGKDVDGKVEYYSKKVLGSIKDLAPVPVSPEATETEDMALHLWRPLNNWLGAALCLLHGMKVAQEVLGSTSEVAVQLKEKAVDLERDVNLAYESLSNSPWAKTHPRSSLVLYDKILGPELRNTQDA